MIRISHFWVKYTYLSESVKEHDGLNIKQYQFLSRLVRLAPPEFMTLPILIHFDI